MSDRIDFGGRPWNAIPREVLRDRTLSPKAKGGLVSLLSHDEGWTRSVIATLQRENACGRTEAKSIMRELCAHGYAKLIQENGAGGRFTTAYTVYAVRQVQGGEPVEPPGTENPTTVGPGTVDLTAVVEPRDGEPLDVEPRNSLAAPDGAATLGQRANVLAKIYCDVVPLSKFPAIAGIARQAIKAGYPDAEIGAALLRLAGEGRGVTTETLRVELDGLPQRRAFQTDRAAEILQGAVDG